MGTKDSRIDEYIKNAEPFARPILNHLRKVVHKACPAVEEKMKWSFPHFDYGGMMCHIAGFKQHCAFGFWLADKMEDPKHIFKRDKEGGMGQLGHIRAKADLPSDKVLIQYIHQAMILNDAGIKLTKKSVSKVKKEIEVPEYFTKALKKNKIAKKVFSASTNWFKKEYISWITEAKTEVTRERRITTAIEWISEGKRRDWKYEKKL